MVGNELQILNGQCLLFSRLNFCSNYFLELSCLRLLQLATLLARDRSVAGLIFILASDKSCKHVTIDPTSEVETKLMSLVKMGYSELEVSMAIERCSIASSVVDLTDFISAAQISKAEDGHLPLEEMIFVHVWSEYPEKSKRKLCESSLLKRKRIMGHGNQIIGEDADAIHLPNPMIGFGTPADLCQIYQNLPKAAAGPPYFYYENVALTRKGVWSTISRFLYDMKPEFVDSKYFCAAARKRGYVYNLPIKNRFRLVPLPPQTIFDAFPMTRRWWRPTWDDRTQLNCLQTCIASATITERIMKALKDYDEDEIPPESVRRYVIYECCKWNLFG